MYVPPISASTFARQFRRLGASERRDFLADLWAARGFETSVDDETGRVTARRNGEIVTIGVVGPLALNPPEADVLVATRSRGRASAKADTLGADLLVPEAVHERLLYGVDREVGNRIAMEHLDTKLTVPPESAGTGIDWARILVLVAVVVAIGAVLGISGAGIPFTGEEAEQFPTPEPATAGSGSATATPEDDQNSAYPAGLNGSGVQNASELSATHWNVIEGRERRVETSYRGPANSTTLPGIVSHEVTGNLYMTNRFNATIVETRVENGSRVAREINYWADGTQRHRLVRSENESHYAQSPLAGRSIIVAVEGFINRIYTGALAANETNVETVQLSGVTVYRISATGEPEGYRDAVDEFSATAFVTPEGRLVNLTVEYTHAPTGEPVEITVTYSKLNDVPPPPRPDWVEENQG